MSVVVDAAQEPELHTFGLSELLELGASPPRWAIPNLAIRGEVSTIFSAAGTGKTTLYQEAVAANAEERPFLHLLGFDGHQSILIFDWENSEEQVARSFGRLVLGPHKGGVSIVFDPPHVNLDTEEGRASVMTISRQKQATVLIFDNRDRAFPNTPELDGERVSAAMSATKRLATKLDVAVLLVSHEPKTPYAGAIDKLRGHSAWAGFSDQMFHLDGSSGTVRRLRHVKHRGVDRLKPLRIKRLQEGNPDTGPVRLVADVEDVGLPSEERLRLDVQTLAEVLKDGPLGITDIEKRVKSLKGGTFGRKRAYAALRSTDRFYQPTGSRGPWAWRRDPDVSRPLVPI